jgi:hypothetical protein
MEDEHRAWRVGAVVWAVLIGASTLTTKQHFFIDCVVASRWRGPRQG